MRSSDVSIRGERCFFWPLDVMVCNVMLTYITCSKIATLWPELSSNDIIWDDNIFAAYYVVFRQHIRHSSSHPSDLHILKMKFINLWTFYENDFFHIFVNIKIYQNFLLSVPEENHFNAIFWAKTVF